jgi:CzcA family heavy metal efflux pump
VRRVALGCPGREGQHALAQDPVRSWPITRISRPGRPMMRAIIQTSLRFRVVVIALAAGVLAVGIVQLRQAPVDVLPEFTPPYVEIQTEALGLSAEEVEQLVTVPLEADLLNGTKGVSVLRSESVDGESSIVLLFEPGTDLMDARQLVQEQLTQAHANPNVSQPPQMLQPLSSESRVMMIGLSPAGLSQIRSSVLARWVIRPRLLGVPGVANVAMFGLRDRQLQVLVDPERLRDKRTTLNQVVSTAGNAQLVSPLSFLEASTPGTGGFFETPNQRLHIRHILPTVTPGKLARVPIEGRDGLAGKPLRLGDVSHVVEDHPPLIGDAVVNGRTGLLLVVEKVPGANTLDVTHDVDEALDDLRPGLSGVKVDSSAFRPADFIDEAIGNLTFAVVLGCLLLALVLFAFLFEWRAALICFVAFAVSLTGAALVLSLTESTINAIVFAGLAMAVGVVIDDAVVAVQNIRRRLSQRGEGGGGAATIVREAAADTLSPMGVATLLILLVVLPVFFISGVSGSFFEPVARSYALAVLASMLVALTVTPPLCLMLLPRESRLRRESPLALWNRTRYSDALSRIINRPRVVAAAVVVAALVGVAVIPVLRGPVIPSFKDRDLVVHLDGQPGTAREEMSRIVARASRELRSVPGVSGVAGHVGRAITGDQVVDVNSSELWVKVASDADYDVTKASIENVLKDYAGLNRAVLTYETQRIRDVGAVDDRQAPDAARRSSDLDVLTGADRRPLVVRVYGEDLAVLRQQATRMKQLLSRVDGVVDPRVESVASQPTVAIKVNLETGLAYGIKPGDVRRKVATLLSGIQVGSVFEHAKVFDVVVRAAPSARQGLTDVRRLLIDTPGGGHVRLSDVADVRVRSTPSVIQREASSRRIDVSANVSGRSVGDVKSDVKSRIDDLQFPLEYHAEAIGATTGDAASATRLLGFGIVAAIGIFLLLHAAFESWRLAALAFSTLPIALVGGVLASLIDGTTFSLGALAGLFAIFAIAARNVIALIDHYQRLERLEGKSLGPELVIQGSGERLAPILTTAFATGLALFPFVFLGNRAGFEIVHPMALVILGGLVTSTLLSLFVVPAFYLRLGAGPRPTATSDDEVLHRWRSVGRSTKRRRVTQMNTNLQSRRLPRLVAVGLVLIIASLPLSACGGSPAEEVEPSGDEAAAVEPIKGTDVNRVILTEDAAKRLGVRTASVQRVGGRKVAPDAAVVYAPEGKTFTYASPKPLTFVRREVTVDHISGTKAVLSHGPPVGTAVVTVGSQELYGVENEYEPE